MFKIKTKPLAPKVQWSVIGLNKPQRQTKSSVICRSANHLSKAFRLHLIDRRKEGKKEGSTASTPHTFLNSCFAYAKVVVKMKQDCEIMYSDNALYY